LSPPQPDKAFYASANTALSVNRKPATSHTAWFAGTHNPER
jgi:hypothetical protein